MCTGPGLAPGVSPEPAAMRLRVTPRGRFVLNAIVAKLAGSFRRIGHMDNAGGAF
jgi:oxygen-independent coproporphyrinogen-3 oxidase